MRTVVGSRGCLAVDLLFRVAGLGKTVAQWPQGAGVGLSPSPRGKEVAD